MRERVLHALDLGMLGDWDGAKRSLDNLDDPIVPRLFSLMTEQQQRERDRAQAQTLARHELGNALSIAQANVEAMLDGILETTPDRLAGIRDALQTCGSLLDDLKKHYRTPPEPGEGASSFDLPHLVAAQIALVSSIAESKNVQLALAAGNEEPVCGPYHGDPERIAQILRNVLLSAVRFTPPGGAIEIDSIGAGGEIQFSVRHSRNGNRDSLGFSVASKLLEALGDEARLISESPAHNTFVFKL